MKNKKLKQGTKTHYSLHEDKQTQEILKHILSPLELTAFKNEFTSFKYNLNGIKITIGAHYGKPLMNSTMTKIRLFADIISGSNRNLLSNSSKHQVFLSKEIKSIGLPAYLKNALRKQGCKTMFDIMETGRRKMEQWRGIGKIGIATLEILFKKNKCEGLF